MNLVPVTLKGQRVRLEPLGREHAADLLEAARHDHIWTHLDEPTPDSLAAIEAFIEDADRDQATGRRLAFAIIDTTSNQAVGSTSYLDIRSADRGVEIGWTWLTPAAWGTGTNAEAKYLLLAHAFDDQDAIRVAIKTDQQNVRSQHAIDALGATREGVWRNHRILSNGLFRHTVYYSVIAEEWPAVRTALRARLGLG